MLFPSQQFLQPRFPFNQRQRPQILSIQKQKIKRKEHAFLPPKQQVIEYRPT